MEVLRPSPVGNTISWRLTREQQYLCYTWCCQNQGMDHMRCLFSFDFNRATGTACTAARSCGRLIRVVRLGPKQHCPDIFIEIFDDGNCSTSVNDVRDREAWTQVSRCTQKH